MTRDELQDVVEAWSETAATQPDRSLRALQAAILVEDLTGIRITDEEMAAGSLHDVDGVRCLLARAVDRRPDCDNLRGG
jgi:hypothetical protein